MGTKFLISLAALSAALVALVSPIASSASDSVSSPAQVRPLSNGDGGGP
jgi:hypothetical protein